MEMEHYSGSKSNFFRLKEGLHPMTLNDTKNNKAKTTLKN